MNPIESIVLAFGIDIGPIEWFIINIAAYFIIGFGGCVFDPRVWRFRNQSTGRFVQWEIPLIVGTTADIIILYAMFEITTLMDKLSSIAGLVLCIFLTIKIGMSTRSY